MKDLLYVFWGLLAILSAIKPPRKGELIQTSLFFVLSLLSKPQAVAIPFMIFLLRISFLKLPVKSEARRLLGFFCLSLPIVILTKVRQLGIGIEPLVPFYQRPLLVLDSSVFYLKKIIWPADLIYTYSRTPSYVANDYGLAWRNLFFAGLFGSGVWLLRKRINLGLWLLLFFLPLAPVLGFLFFSFQEYSTVADRFAYLSFLAPSLLLATLYPRIPSRFSVFLWLLTPALIFLTQRQLPLWANERVLLERRSEIFDLETKQEKTFQLLISELAAGPPTLQQIQNLSKYTAEWARLDPFSPLPQWVHGSILQQLGDRKRADGFIQRARSFSPPP